ncbi:hypothetical protein JCM8115_000094 [Rhodotorula mucilaginosa]
MPVLHPTDSEEAPAAAVVDAHATESSSSPPSRATAEPPTTAAKRMTTSAGETVETIACGHALTLADGSRVALCRVRPSKRCFIPPPQFGLVCEGLVRSGQPTEVNFPFLAKLSLKTVVWLAPEVPSDPFLDFLKENNIAWHHVGADEFLATYDPLSEEAVLEALELILDPANVPCAVMCNQGRHRTGVVVGVLRKLQRWNLVSILEEYRRYAGPKVRVNNEQFIELFQVEVIRVPPPPPLEHLSTAEAQ